MRIVLWYMASLDTLKVHEQSRTFRMRLPSDWVKKHAIRSKDALDVIVSETALIVLPPKEVTQKDIDDLILDIKSLIPARTMLRASESKTRENTPITSETCRPS